MGSVKVVEWPPFEKELLPWLTMTRMFSLYHVYIFHFGFDERIFVVIVPVHHYAKHAFAIYSNISRL